jgi:hypothetical protein
VEGIHRRRCLHGLFIYWRLQIKRAKVGQQLLSSSYLMQENPSDLHSLSFMNKMLFQIYLIKHDTLLAEKSIFNIPAGFHPLAPSPNQILRLNSRVEKFRGTEQEPMTKFRLSSRLNQIGYL